MEGVAYNSGLGSERRIFQIGKARFCVSGLCSNEQLIRDGTPIKDSDVISIVPSIAGGKADGSAEEGQPGRL